MRGRSSGKTGPPATRASPGKAGGLLGAARDETRYGRDTAPTRMSIEAALAGLNVSRMLCGAWERRGWGPNRGLSTRASARRVKL